MTKLFHFHRIFLKTGEGRSGFEWTPWTHSGSASGLRRTPLNNMPECGHSRKGAPLLWLLHPQSEAGHTDWGIMPWVSIYPNKHAYMGLIWVPHNSPMMKKCYQHIYLNLFSALYCMTNLILTFSRSIFYSIIFFYKWQPMWDPVALPGGGTFIFSSYVIMRAQHLPITPRHPPPPKKKKQEFLALQNNILKF